MGANDIIDVDWYIKLNVLDWTELIIGNRDNLADGEKSGDLECTDPHSISEKLTVDPLSDDSPTCR